MLRNFLNRNSKRRSSLGKMIAGISKDIKHKILIFSQRGSISLFTRFRSLKGSKDIESLVIIKVPNLCKRCF